MSYVPIVPSPPQPPSPRTRELATLLSKVLDEYRKAHPAVTSAEIRAAIRMATLSSSGGSQALPAVVAAGAALGVGMVALGLYLFESGGDAEWVSLLPGVILVAIVLLLVVVKVRSR